MPPSGLANHLGPERSPPRSRPSLLTNPPLGPPPPLTGEPLGLPSPRTGEGPITPSHEAAEQREALAEDDDHETLAERIQATDDATDLRAQTTRRTERVSSDRPTPEKVVHLRQHARRDRLDRERARQQAEAETDADSSEAATPRPAEPPRHKPES